MDNLIEIKGHFVSNGNQVPFQLQICMPEQVEPYGDYLCRVSSSELFTRCMNVHGVSRYQAIQLALTYVREALTSKVVTEQDLADDIAKRGEETNEQSQ